MLTDSIQNIEELWARRQYGAPDTDHVAALLDALLNDRFRFQAEAWMGESASNARELLLRAWDAEGVAIPPGTALSKLHDEGLLPVLDKFLIFAALRKVRPVDDKAITLNALSSTLASASFWDELRVLPHAHEADQVVFEILEYECDYEVNGDLLGPACADGYRFALDDFYPSGRNWRRLDDYAAYLDYVKLDGRFVRAGLAGSPAFDRALSKLQNYHPNLDIIAEHVSTRDEAALLFQAGIAVVQGRALAHGRLSHCFNL